MSVQTRADYSNIPFVRSGQALYREAETVAQDVGRVGDMVKFTLMAYNPTLKKWVPFSNEAAVDGTQIPKGVLNATLSEAEIKAGDVVNVPILVGSVVIVDQGQLVIENAKTLDTIVNIPANLNQSVKDLLAMIGIFTEATIDIDAYEN